jgi:hypothetical protein
LRTKANKLEDTITGYERSIDDYATKSNSSQNEYEKEYNNQMIRQYKDLHAKANKEADDNEFQIRKQKAILKSAEEELLKEVAYIKNQPKPNEMCRPEEYNPDCDGGVGPSGDPRLILSQKGALGQKLIELASQKIANIPIKECNVITKACNGNSVEVTAEELQMMMDSIANEAMEDDGACDWTPLNGCSFFDSNGQSKWYYMNLLWDPTPDFNSIIEYLPTK